MPRGVKRRSGQSPDLLQVGVASDASGAWCQARGVPTQASAGAISTRSPPSTRQSETACSSPAQLGCVLTGDVARLERARFVPDPDGVRVVLVVALGNEREPAPGVERRVVDDAGAEGDARYRDDAQARVLPSDPLARRRVAQVVTRFPALEPEPKPPGRAR